MNSRAGPNYKGKNVSQGGSNPEVDQMVQGFAGTKLAPSQDDDGGEWEVFTKKNKNKSGKSHNQNPTKACGVPQQGRGNNVYGKGNANGCGTQGTGFRVFAGRGQAMNRNNYVAPPPTLEGGWDWKKSRAGSSCAPEVPYMDDDRDKNVADESDDECDAFDDGSDEEDLASNDYDSDESQKSHETRKKNKWFKKFFERLDRLSMEQINETEKKWHCPACQNGRGAVDWYNLQTLLAHARTKGAKRVKLHREFAQVLDSDLLIRGASVIPCGDFYGKWNGLGDEDGNHLNNIVWPPMVIIMNTRLDKDDNDKWLGMGNEELLVSFDKYHPIRARHSYGPQGHRGMSVLIFESNASGYVNAEFLDTVFAQKGLDRNTWESRGRGLFYGDVRQLYGFLATKQDLELFNKHSHGKTRLDYEMRSYKEMIVEEVSQIYEDNQHLKYYKEKYKKEKERNEELEETVDKMRGKLRKTERDNRDLRQRTKLQYEQNREEMDSQDKFLKETLKLIDENRDAQEENFETQGGEEEL